MSRIKWVDDFYIFISFRLSLLFYFVVVVNYYQVSLSTRLLFVYFLRSFYFYFFYYLLLRENERTNLVHCTTFLFAFFWTRQQLRIKARTWKKRHCHSFTTEPAFPCPTHPPHHDRLNTLKGKQEEETICRGWLQFGPDVHHGQHHSDGIPIRGCGSDVPKPDDGGSEIF